MEKLRVIKTAADLIRNYIKTLPPHASYLTERSSLIFFEQYNRSPVLTFDQPLYWKAIEIQIWEKSDSVYSRAMHGLLLISKGIFYIKSTGITS